MENNYNAYSSSRDSSPRSRETDCESPAWEEQQQQQLLQSPTYKVKLMCSFGGKIQPRPHDNQLAYVDGDTKILSVDRNIKYSAFMSKLSSFSASDFCFKYQLPGENLDALISVTNDEDLDHMMLEYDRVYSHHTFANRPARLRLFLFPLNPVSTSFDSNSSKPESRWFVDALNAVFQHGDDVSPTAQISPKTPDYLFGLDKGAPVASPVPVPKLQDPPPVPAVIAMDAISKENSTGSDQGSEDRNGTVRDPVLSQAEIQRQIQELQRLQVATAVAQDQVLLQNNTDEANMRICTGEYYTQKVPEKLTPIPQQTMATQMPMPRAYWPEQQQQQQQHMSTVGGGGGGTYQQVAAAPRRDQQPVYIIPTTAMYQTQQGVRPVANQIGQTYYGIQRLNTEVYREQPIYNVVPSSSMQQQQQQPKVGEYAQATIGMAVRAPSTTMGMAEAGYAQVAYDATGR